jgi:hypothetical protein
MRGAKSLADALASSPAGNLLHRVAQSAELAKVIKGARGLPPDFDPNAPGICELRDSVLWLSAHSPAQAAKLRQSLPGLQQLLLRHGFEVIEIRVRIQPGLTAYQGSVSGPQPAHVDAEAAARAGLDQQAPLEFAEKLALTLRDSPLRAAARSLADRLRQRRRNA